MGDYCIYYGDGSTFTGQPEDAPTENVQAITFPDPREGYGDKLTVVLKSWDFYIYSDPVGGWHATDKYACLLDHLKRGCGPGGVRAVLTGRWIDRATYDAIEAQAMAAGNVRVVDVEPYS